MRQRIRVGTAVAGLVASATLVAAGSVADTVSAQGAQQGGNSEQSRQNRPLEMKILHINDHHSHLSPDDGFGVDLGTGVGEVEYQLGGFPQVVEKFQQLEGRGQNTVKVHAGDAVTGTLFYSLFKGEADAALMNEVCFDMFALGNHEFDDGDAQLANGFLTDLASDPSCDTPVIAANVVPEVGTPLQPSEDESFIQPYVIEEFVGGQKVGFIGLDIAQKTKQSSSPLESTEFLDEVETAQQYVNELTEMGIENIVLVTHYQYDNDLELAGQVTDIDAIIGGDSHTLLGDFATMGLNSSGPYPTLTTNADGDPVCVAQAWQYSYVVGELNVTFEDGKNVGCEGTPHLLVSEPDGGYTKEVVIDGEEEDVPLTAREKRDFERALRDVPNVTIARPDQKAQRILDEYNEQVSVLEQQEIGAATEDLCLERIPGQGRSQICEINAVSDSGAVSNVNGGFIQQIVTDAFAARAFRADFAIQNAGGVRIDIPKGPITIADAYELLPFANTLVELELSGQEVVDVLEEAVTFAIAPGGSTGAYPYGSKIRWDADLSAAEDNRISNIEIFDGSVWAPIDVGATYIVVTNSFIASGRDGYITFGTAFDDGRVVDTFIDYAQGFIDWVEQDAGGVVSVPEPSMFSTQNFKPVPAP